MNLIESVVDFMWESSPDEIEMDSVCCAVLEDDGAQDLLLQSAATRWKDDWHNHAEFIGRLFRVVMSMGLDTDFIGDTYWDMVSDGVDGGVVEGDWEFTYMDEDDESYTPVSYDETYKQAEWRVMYNFGHDFHWSWRETCDGSLEEMVTYCLSRVAECNKEAWVAQGYPEIVL